MKNVMKNLIGWAGKKKRLNESEQQHKINLKTKRRAKNKIARMSRRINRG